MDSLLAAEIFPIGYFIVKINNIGKIKNAATKHYFVIPCGLYGKIYALHAKTNLNRKYSSTQNEPSQMDYVFRIGVGN